MAKEQGPSLVPVPADTPKVQSAVPWYESTALWGALGAAVAIVLVVVAAMVKDLRWLLIVAWPFFCLAGWAALRGVKRSIIKWPSIGFTSCLIGCGLLWANSILRPVVPSVSAECTSEIVALVHSRAPILPSGNTEVYRPQFRDLFHDWIIKLVPRGVPAGVMVLIRDHRSPTDQIRVMPPNNAVITNTKPGWLSGFDEPTHAPDFFVRTVTFAALGEPTTITIRRPIKPQNQTTNVITTMELDLDRVVQVSAHCIVTHIAPAKLDAWFDRLSDQLRTLALWQGANGPAPTRMNPDDPFPPLADKQSELISEVRCKDAPCKNLLVTMAEHGKW